LCFLAAWKAPMTLLITHSACLEHLTSPGHPECPERLRAIERVAIARGCDGVKESPAPGGA